MKNNIFRRVLALTCIFSMCLEFSVSAIETNELLESNTETPTIQTEGKNILPDEDIPISDIPITVVPAEDGASVTSEVSETLSAIASTGEVDVATTLSEYVDTLKATVWSSVYNTELNAPFSKTTDGIRESISPETGALILENTLFTMPGRNGFDFTLSLVYNSQQAKKYDEATADFEYNVFSSMDACLDLFTPSGHYIGTSISSFGWGDTISSSENESVFTGYYIEPNGSLGKTNGIQNYARQKSPIDAGQDLFGLGWSIGTPHLIVDGNRVFVTLQDGQVYEADFDLIHGIKDYELSNVTFSQDTSICIEGETSAYRLRYADGNSNYYASNGEILLQEDRYGNRIQYLYADIDGARVISEISNNAGKKICFDYQDSETIIQYGNHRYVLQKTSIDGVDILTACVDPADRKTKYQYDIHTANFDILGSTPAENKYASLTCVTYETGLATFYEYQKATKDLADGFMEYFKISRRWDKDTQQTNLQTYTYYGEPDGYPTYQSDAIPDDYQYYTIVTTNEDFKTRYTYNYRHQLIETQESAGKENRRSITEYSTKTNLPSYQATFLDCQGNMTLSAVYRWQYDLYGNVIAVNAPPSPELLDSEEYLISSRYDSRYNQPLLKSYKQDEATTIQIVYELSEDGKNVVSETQYVNGVLFSKATYAYDEFGNLVTISNWVSDDSWAIEHRQYLNGLFMTSVAQGGIETADGRKATVKTQYTYDSDTGEVLSQTDRNGNITSYTYDAVGRIIREALPDNSFRTYVYEDDSNSLITTDAEGGALQYCYTPSGLLSSVANCSSGQVLASYTYDQSEQLLSETNGIGTQTRYAYDTWGRITEKSVYSAQGELVSQQTISYENVISGDSVLLKLVSTVRDNTVSRQVCQYYDSRERLVRSTRGDEATTYSYNYLDQNTSVKNSSGNITATTYDSRGNVTSVTDALGNTSYYKYDGLGNQVSYTDPLGNVSRTRINALGLLVAEEIPMADGTVAIKKYWYDDIGNLIRVQDAEGGEILYSYDNRGNLMGVSQPISPSESFNTAYTYDREGRLLTSSTGDVAHSYTYDSLGNVIQETDALGQTISYSYDAVGNLLKTVDRNGVETTCIYDALSREVFRYNSKDGRDNGTSNVYSLGGLLVQSSNTEESYSYHYDEFGRVTELFTASGLRKVYTYDSGDRVTSLKVYQGSVQEMDLAYEYDAAGQLTAVVGDGIRTAYTYDAAGRLEEEKSGLTGVTTSFSYTPSGQIATLVSGIGKMPLKWYSYEYDGNGNQTLKSENGAETRYYYDAIGRLELAELPDGTTQHYTYDDRGNRSSIAEITSSGILVTTYSYDPNNRLLYSRNAREAYRYEYDAQGSQISKTQINYTDNGTVIDQTEYDWNGAGLLSHSIDSAGTITSYGYGPDGLRVRKTTGDEETRYLYENGNILLELNGDNLITAKTVRGHRLISRETQEETYGYLQDGHGDVTGLVNAAGQVILDYAYDPFGNEKSGQSAEANSWDNPFRYCGEYYDAETETYYLRARYYDSEIGRFLSEDTYWNPQNMLGGNEALVEENVSSILQSSNLYAYCMGNPITFVDREGTSAETVFDFLSFLGSAYAIYKEPSGKNLVYLLWDASALVIPLAPGSYTAKGLKTLDNLDDIGDASRSVDNISKSIYEVASSKVLRKNMVAKGIREPKYAHAAHHIVAGSASNVYAQEARRILNKYGISINDAANGVFLPTVKNVSEAAYHPALHTKDYYRSVAESLRSAENKEDVYRILEDISLQLQVGIFPY